MRLHLDTSFMVDWERKDPRIAALRDEMLAGVHDVSYDSILEAEYFAVQHVTRELETVFATMEAISRRVPISADAARLTARWTARMDDKQRKAHFADAVIAGVASTEGAILVTGDAVLPTVFPVAVLQY